MDGYNRALYVEILFHEVYRVHRNLIDFFCVQNAHFI